MLICVTLGEADGIFFELYNSLAKVLISVTARGRGCAFLYPINERVNRRSIMMEKTKIMDLPGPVSAELLERKKKVVARGVSNTTDLFINKAKGAIMYDVDGNRFIDFYGGIGVLNVGHCPDSVVAAIEKQAKKLIHSCFMVSMYEPYVELAEKLVEISPGDSPKKIFLANSGAEAVENAVKFARAAQKKSGIICFEGGFHGRTLLAMTLTSKVNPYKMGFGPFAPDVYKLPAAYCYRCPYNSSYPGCGMHCLERFQRFFTLEATPESIAALIIEPVQGEGGFIIPPKEFLLGLKAICEKHGILFIADEVQSGFARTGKMFAIEHYGIEPDMMTVAKSIAAGMPLSGVIGKAHIMDAPDLGNVGGTYGGNPLACVAGIETIKYIQEQGLVERAESIGQKVMARLRILQEKYEIIGDIRGLGAMIGIELVKNRQTKEPAKELAGQITKACYKRGLIILSAGIFGNVIRMLMPLVITDAELDEALFILEEAFAEVVK